MRVAMLLLALVTVSGCGGVLVVEDRAPAPPHVAPVPHHVHHDIDRDEAVQIAIATARRRHGAAVHLLRVHLAGHQWKVQLWTAAGRGYETTIDIRVDQRSGKVLSHKSKTRRAHRHGHGHGHDRDHDDI